jgi:hypothetical protein
MNKHGRRTVDLLEKLDEAREAVHLGGPPADPEAVITATGGELDAEGLAMLAKVLGPHTDPVSATAYDWINQLIDEGEQHVAFWTSVVHGDDLRSASEARAIKAGWEAWGRDGMAIVRAYAIPVSHLGPFSGRL